MRLQPRLTGISLSWAHFRNSVCSLKYECSWNYVDNVLYSRNWLNVSLCVSFGAWQSFSGWDLTCIQCPKEQAPSWAGTHSAHGLQSDTVGEKTGLTLKHLDVWIMEWHLCMPMMSVCVEGAHDAQGGALVSLIHSCTEIAYCSQCLVPLLLSCPPLPISSSNHQN
jgi:hypothetical protein